MTFLIFMLVLSVLVLVHEMGHFSAAKLMGIKVEEFGFGLPFTPAILKIKNRKSGTLYSIYPLLFGGFVRLYGEEKEMTEQKHKSFWSRGKRQRMAVILAGVVMNLVLAMVLFVSLYGVVGVPTMQKDKVTLVGITKNSPAAVAGLLEGDRVVAVEGRTIGSLDEFSTLMKSWAGVGVNLTVERGQGTALFEGIVEKVETTKIINIVPRANPPKDEGALGVVIASYPYLQVTRCSLLSPTCMYGAVKQGFSSTGLWIGRVFDGLRMIGKSLMAGKSPEGVSGPVGIYQLTGVVAAEGFLPLLELVAILSVNLAVFNVLPIPALDGGRLVFVVWEMITRRRVSQQIEQRVNSLGMAFLLGLMVLVSLQDVLRLGIINKILGK